MVPGPAPEHPVLAFKALQTGPASLACFVPFYPQGPSFMPRAGQPPSILLQGGGERKGKKGAGEKRQEEGGEAGRGPGRPGGLTLLAVEDSQEAEHEGPTGGSEEAPPVVPHREVGGHDLDAEQDAWR